jgi:hypothetical protein
VVGKRGVVPGVSPFARWQQAAEGHAPHVDRPLIHLKDSHWLEGSADRGVRRFVQDLHSTSGPNSAWQQIYELFLAKLRGADLLDWSRVLVDTCLLKAPLGGPKQGRIRRTRPLGQQAWCATDAQDIPLVVQTLPANQHDVTTLIPLLVDLPKVQGKPGRPKQLMADKAFDDQTLRAILRWLKIEPVVPNAVKRSMAWVFAVG